MQCSKLIRSSVGRLLHAGECSLTCLSNHVGVLALNRPSRRNAVGRQLLSDLQACIRICVAQQNEIRCVVLESCVDGAFCAGADLKERRTMTVEEAFEYLKKQSSTFSELEDLHQPVVAAVEGAALGGGCELALCADIRVAGAAATFGLPETGLGIIPGAGGTFRAPRAIGLTNALQLILTGEVVTAERALAMGLVSDVRPVGGAGAVARELATRIAQNGPLAVAAAKASVRYGIGRGRTDALDNELQRSRMLIATRDRQEGLDAFAEKRVPQFLGT
ncbi:putative Enoyl CoA hydratase isomerase [Trypanosoma vivax]|nr:methylglutaconyl-CoA hydratase precursor [Trypanosoma vivax]KAH8608068.1 putative Enoyl CoA hydratase isomerase [Trypanosoma vivax]